MTLDGRLRRQRYANAGLALEHWMRLVALRHQLQAVSRRDFARQASCVCARVCVCVLVHVYVYI